MSMSSPFDFYPQVDVERDDLLRQDGYWQAFPQHYFKTDCLRFDQPFGWRGHVLYPPPHGQGGKLMISGHSDYPIDDAIVERYQPEVMWCVNKQTRRANVFSLPLGLPNSTFENQDRPYGNIDVLFEARSIPRSEHKLCYMNISVWTYPQERQIIFDRMNGLPWVTTGTSQHDLEGRRKYLYDLRSHSFTFCPRGNGVDTHRLWEALYMGSIPIVRRDLGYDDFTELPICWVNDWTEVTPEFLEREKVRIANGTFNMNKIKLSYWVDKMRACLTDVY